MGRQERGRRKEIKGPGLGQGPSRDQSHGRSHGRRADRCPDLCHVPCPDRYQGQSRGLAAKARRKANQGHGASPKVRAGAKARVEARALVRAEARVGVRAGAELRAGVRVKAEAVLAAEQVREAGAGAPQEVEVAVRRINMKLDSSTMFEYYEPLHIIQIQPRVKRSLKG